MSASDLHGAVGPEDASQVWDLLGQRVDELIAAWESGDESPDLANFVPEAAPGIRQLLLVELIKVDLEFGWQSGRRCWCIEQYLEAWPELVGAAGPPVDLLYEEYHVRRRAGDEVEPQDYFERFPGQSTQLGRLLGLEEPDVTTSLARSHSLPEFDEGQRLEDFDLLAKVGQGAFAQVFLAFQRSMQRMVALKISADRGSEPQTMAQLDHPHIVRVYDQRQLPGQRLRLLYMQYIAGGTLRGIVERVRKTPPEARTGRLLLESIDEALAARGEAPPAHSGLRSRLPTMSWPEAVCWLGARIAEALDYAHSHGVLHRDIKPANVLLAPDGSPKLVDFNVSFSSAIEGVTAAAYFGGSLAYMSPEQLEACHPDRDRQPEDLDGRSDLFSLGVMLWELLTGSRPYIDDTVQPAWTDTLDRLAAARRRGIDPLAQAMLPRNSPAGLDQVLLRCLAPDPADRPASGAQLARQLELCLQPRARQLLRGPTDSWGRLIRRHPALTLVAFGLLPNIVMSALNIEFNANEMVGRLAEVHPELEAEFHYRQLPIVNGILYPLGVAILLRLAWPVLRAAGKRSRGEQVSAEQRAGYALRATMVPDWVAWIVIAAWLISGIVFPAWLHAKAGAGSAVGPLVYVHFAVSQALTGLIAGTLSFFFVAYACVRLILPLLVDVEVFSQDLAARAVGLARRTWLYVALAVAVPFLAMLWFAGAGVISGEGLRRAQVIYVGIVAGIGLADSILALRIARMLQTDLAALAHAMRPTGRVGEETETADTFWG